MPGDLIDITIMATDRTSVQPFNRRVVDITPAGTSLTAEELNYYLVDNSGYIDMPVIGRVKVQGMTKSQLENHVRSQIYPKYIHEVPSVTVRFENFRVSILGDVYKPGCLAGREGFQRISRSGLLTAAPPAGSVFDQAT
jgi:polysaccharide export outer membrane protein